MFYKLSGTYVGDTYVRCKVELIEKNQFFTEVLRTLTLNIPIEEGRTVFTDEVNSLVEQALKDAGIVVEGPEFPEPSRINPV